MKKLSRNEMKQVAGGRLAVVQPSVCLAMGAYCGNGCTDPDKPTIPCCAGLTCSGGGIIAGQCVGFATS